MARHIMAVCVVCLLCAHRLHCQDHVEVLNGVLLRQKAPLNAIVYNTIHERNPVPSLHETTDANDADGTQNYSTSPPYRRRKQRHATHEHHMEPDSHMPEITQQFLQKLMSDEEHLSADDFSKLVNKLGLQQLLDSNNNNNNGTCVSSSQLVHHVQPHDLSHKKQWREHNLLETNNNNTTCTTCVQSNLSLTTAITSEYEGDFKLNARDVMNLCPVLLYHVSSHSDGCIDPSMLSNIDKLEEQDFDSHRNDDIYVWIYSFISVFACGLLGLVGVAIIPFMGSYYYKHIIQYLVSLAVGTMTGDALLHLLPHSLAGQDEHGMVMKGLAVLGGIIFFYVTEHALTMISEWRKNVEKKETKKPSRARVVRDPDSSVNNSVAGDRMCKQKYSSYPYCYDEITMDNKQDVWIHLPGDNNATPAAVGAPADCSTVRSCKSDVNDRSIDSAGAAQSLLSTSHNNYAEMNNHHHHHHHNHNHNNHQLQDSHAEQQQQENNTTIANDIDGNAAIYSLGGSKDSQNQVKPAAAAAAHDKSGPVTVILREHESSHHGHSHRHGHVHSPPETLSAVAWMIIMGDGLHNFTDGMAIGAAFADNIAGGFSTSLAVFCHELPHELGDFAILMKAGMSVKSAVYYNLLTGVLSFIGMIFGIVFGKSPEMAQWMFAVAAGLFIYIALVDMMPEISAAHKSIGQFLLQILGMLSGLVIMLIIALYEHDLINAFGSAPKHVH